MAIKDKEGKVMKILAYNQNLTSDIESLRPTMLNEMSNRKSIGRLSMHNINLALQEDTNSSHKKPRCHICMDVVPDLQI